MIDAARRAGRVFSVHQNRRWDEDCRIVRKVLAEGTIGKPFSIESRVQGSRGIPGDWRCVKEAGGGMLLDWGVHLIDQILWMVDSPVVEVYAHLLSVRFQDVDDNFKLLMKFENGLSALVQVDTLCFSNLPRWHVSGDAGTLVVDDWSCRGRIVKARTVEFRMEEGIVYTKAGPTRTMAPRPVETIEEIPLPAVESDWTDYYRNVVAAVEEREQLIVKPEQALRVLRVIDAAFESSSKGICVKDRI
jgi:scyllo-inositol 2-dehydrogenase (NADP+)